MGRLCYMSSNPHLMNQILRTEYGCICESEVGWFLDRQLYKNEKGVDVRDLCCVSIREYWYGKRVCDCSGNEGVLGVFIVYDIKGNLALRILMFDMTNHVTLRRTGMVLEGAITQTLVFFVSLCTCRLVGCGL